MPMSFEKELQELRKKINGNDEHIVKLISERAKFAQEIGLIKKKT